MFLPKLTELAASRRTIDAFRGYNHNLRIRDGEWYDMENMTSDHYPVLSPRAPRGRYAAPASAQGLIAKDSLCYVDGSAFVINGYRVEMGLSTAAEDCPKRLVSMGAYVIILPDKQYINTAELTDFGPIEASVVTSDTVTFSLSKADGSLYGSALVSAAEPGEARNMDLWVDTSATPHCLKQYSAASGMWVTIPTTYIRIDSPGIGAPFARYDGVTISGVEDESLAALNGTMVIQDRGEDYIVVIGLLDSVITQTGPVTAARLMPNLDFVIESENRLWGCRYGVALNGKVVNELYASKLGDFKNWNCFQGISTDSYAVSLGSDGPFTGAVTHLGYPCFFKENCLHKVYGSYPANYQVQTTLCRGVEKGSERSLAIVNEVLYYKGRTGICAYDGSLPTEISAPLGTVSYSGAVAGGHRNKYYVSMADSAGQWHLFVYDTVNGLWHREDATRADSWCSCRNELYYIDHADGAIRTVCGSGEPETGPVEWMAQTGKILVDAPEKKYLSSMALRMSLTVGARVELYVRYDSAGQWDKVFSAVGKGLRSFLVPIRPRRCDHMELRIRGRGEGRIYSIVKFLEQGSVYR